MNNMNKTYVSPESLFARFLQRKAKMPTQRQLNVWEDDGGNFSDCNQNFVILNGKVCCTFSEKLQGYALRYWRMTKLFFREKRFQLQH
jgi:hypothetical protein